MKWYDAARGFGFVLLGSGRDAFLHAAVLRRSGRAEPGQGERISCLVGSGPRGLQVEAILGAEPAEAGADEPCPAAYMTGKVKFYDVGRGYGFILADTGEEVFVGAKLLRKLRLMPLREDQCVRVSVRRGERGMVAETLTFLS